MKIKVYGVRRAYDRRRTRTWLLGLHRPCCCCFGSDCFPVSVSVPFRLRPILRALLFWYCGACAAGSRDQVRARERGWYVVVLPCGGMMGAFRRNARVVLITAITEELSVIRSYYLFIVT